MQTPLASSIDGIHLSVHEPGSTETIRTRLTGHRLSEHVAKAVLPDVTGPQLSDALLPRFHLDRGGHLRDLQKPAPRAVASTPTPHADVSGPASPLLLPLAVPDDCCPVCESLLVPPELATGFRIPRRADYVCLKCRRVYAWVGHPRRLVAVGGPAPRVDE
jgi:hypothetical protein